MLMTTTSILKLNKVVLDSIIAHENNKNDNNDNSHFVGSR